MKRILKMVGIGLGILILIVSILGIIVHKPLPQGKKGPEADALAQKMLKALNQSTYQNTRFLQWSFHKGRNHYKWDRKRGICTVRWSDNEVTLNFNQPEKSEAVHLGKIVPFPEAQGLVNKALSYFNNDSFWLVAPYKVFDTGTARSLVTLEDGSQGLLVTYTTGGNTPGDSYLWRLNPNGFPQSYQMWVKIIPLGGLKASWDDWMVTESGAFLPKSHKLGPLTLSMGNVKGYNN